MRIGLDMDGVVYDYVANLSRIVVENGGDPIPDNCGWFKPTDLWPEYFNHPKEVFFDGPPIVGARGGCHNLKKAGHELWIITAAWPEAAEFKIAWLEKMGIEYDDFVLTSLDHSAEPKSAVRCDLYIDDGAHNIEELYENTDAYLIIFEQSWNRTTEMFNLEADDSSRVVRARNWLEVEKLVEEVNVCTSVVEF